jgi:glycosyltransferase involved in cell wall biosynthesis
MALASPQAGPLRVLYSFPHPLGDPGIGTTALNQVRGLIERGLEVTVYCTSMAEEIADPHRIVQTMTVAGRRIPHRAFGVHWAYRYHDHRVAAVLRRRAEDHDVVHTWPLGGAATLAIARRHGLVGLRESPNVYTGIAYERTAHEAAALRIDLPRRSSHRFSRRRLSLEEREYELAYAVLAPSDAVKQSFAQRSGPAIRIIRHRYGFDPERFPRPPRQRPDRPFTLIFLGQGEPRKGLHYALEAWRTSDIAPSGGRFIICGDLMPEYGARLSATLDQPGVEVRPFARDVGAVLREADALILPSVEEGSALVTYEAQASGCALLVSDASGALMTDRVHGFIHRVGDVEQLSNQLRLIATDGALLARLRTNVLDHRTELTWAAAAGDLEGAYRACLTR